MEKGLLLKKSIFIKQSKEDIREFYNIDPKQIGCGAYGKIFLASLKSKPNTLRAIKIIPKRVSYSQFASQILILKILDHPSLLKLYEIYEDKKQYYLVTDYFEGGDLFARLEQAGEFCQEEAKEIFRQALEAVAYCHSQKVVHRDIKPENIMFLNKKGLSLKLIDFGLAFRWEKDARQQLKRGSKAAGTMLYMSPEMICSNYNEKCDIWSLGVLLYILITAEFPFDGSSDAELMRNIQRLALKTRIENINASQDLKDLLIRLFSKQALRPTANQIFQHPWLQKKQAGLPLKLNFSKLVSFSKFSKLKMLSVTYIASQLSEKQIEKLSVLFKQLDLNHDGLLSMEQLKVAFENQKQKSSLTDLSKLIEFIDTDRNGKINYTEFITCCLENSVIFKEENLKAAFRLLDRDENGKIQREELRELLKESSYENQTLEEMIKSCDKNGDGYIDYKEFVESISKR